MPYDAPNLDRLAIIDEHGHRQKVQPADVDGKLTRLKPFVRYALIAIFVALPWIDVAGHPAVLFDLPARRFYLFGAVLTPTDLPLLFFLLTAIGWSLVVLTTLFGRAWCGWACPQTVYLEGVFRRIERAIEGTGAQRMLLDRSPWHARKIWKKSLKWSLWLVASFVVAHIFLSYFVSIPGVVDRVLDDPREHWPTFLVALAATGVTYFNFAWFREQTCLIICPYGRLQSAMQDRDTITIGYDKARASDCVDCKRCIAVCPTGIDIRNGLQMECIACASCVDACDHVMDKLKRPRGLIRYDSERGFARQPRRIVRPRLLAYFGAGLVGLSVLLVFALTRTPISARVVRPAGAPYGVVDGMIQNIAMVHVENRTSDTRALDLIVSAPESVTIAAPQRRVELAPGGRHDFPLVVRAPRDGTKRVVQIEVRDDDDERSVYVTLPVLTP